MPHERPAALDLPVEMFRRPVVEVHVAANNIGLEANNDRQTEAERVELDLMALRLQQELIEDDDFQVELRDDGLMYVQLQ